jgi:exodeoxyribonuclease-3
MIRVITLNVNGIRASQKKGLFDWLLNQKADVICLQEVRAPLDILSKDVFQLSGYHCYYEVAERKGYSGVAIYSKKKPLNIKQGLGFELADTEGRYIHAEYENFVVASLYLPSGTSGDERQDLKYEFLDKYEAILCKIKKDKKQWIIAGDWNIAHKEIDLKNWKPNQKNSGFLPEERAWLDKIFYKKGFIDAFREVNKNPDQYTWWSNRGRAWDNNVGWRIDYQVVTPGLKGKVKNASIYRDERFSDHSPLIIDYVGSL